MPNWDLMSQNIDKDFSKEEQLVAGYLNAGLKLSDLKECTMRECNMIYNACEISNYKEFELQRANYTKHKK